MKGGMVASHSRRPQKHADAGRPIGFVAGESVKVDTKGPHVERSVGCALGAVDHDLGTGGTRDFHHLADVGQRAGHVGAMRLRNETATPGQMNIQLCKVEPPLRRHR